METSFDLHVMIQNAIGMSIESHTRNRHRNTK